MILYQRKTLATGANLGDPGPVPECLLGWHDEALADVSATAPEAAVELGFAGQGFFPVDIPDPVQPSIRIMNKVDFLRLFTNLETFHILQASLVNPDVSAYKYRLDLANDVNLDDVDIQLGITALEAGKLLGPGRAVKILAGKAP
jgi:hypothetical protein